MSEVQRHGFDFENWITQTFFSQFDTKYTDKWDIPITANNLKKVPQGFRHLPVSIKTCKFGSPIGFGDAIRQFNNNEDFLLIVGFWKQSGKNKNFISVEAVKVLAVDWKKLFYPLDLQDLLTLDSIIKNLETHYLDARRQAKEIKKSVRFSETTIVLNPKIDSKKQRRLQCSLPFNIFWRNFAKVEPSQNINCKLFGESVPNPFISSSRTFKSKPS